MIYDVPCYCQEEAQRHRTQLSKQAELYINSKIQIGQLSASQTCDELSTGPGADSRNKWTVLYIRVPFRVRLIRCPTISGPKTGPYFRELPKCLYYYATMYNHRHRRSVSIHVAEQGIGDKGGYLYATPSRVMLVFILKAPTFTQKGGNC